jgi:two-component system cell cycle sensor histidine kinase PleC
MLIATTPSRAMIEQSMRLVAGLAMESQLDISIEEGPWPTVMADSRAIKQVMINMLSNAVKFSPRGSPIKVASKLDDGRLTISVRDFGCGIAAEELARLGRPYEQAGDQASYRQGTGLGLSLSMNLIAKHGGPRAGRHDGEFRPRTFARCYR